MANKWGIPIEVETDVKERDMACVYCGIHFIENQTIRKHKSSWEHIVNDVRINGIDNIALCCVSCNASKGAKDLDDWLTTDYCKRKNITSKTVAEVIKTALIKKPKLSK